MKHSSGNSVTGDEFRALAELEEEVGAFFDRCAHEGLMIAFSPEEEAKLQTFFLSWNIQPGDRVLEPGCGSGRLTRLLAEAVGEEGLVFACDLSSGMIESARARQLPGNVETAVCSVNSVPFDACFFDKVICVNTFPHLSDFGHALAEMTRVLKPRGDLWINHFRDRNHVNDFHRHSSAVICGHLIPGETEMQRLLDEAGFEVADYSDTDDMYSVHAVKSIHFQP